MIVHGTKFLTSVGDITVLFTNCKEVKNKKLNMIATWLCISLAFIVRYEAAKILGVTFVPMISHQTFFNSIWKELSLRGHDVTAVSTFPLRDSSLTNLTVIDVSFLFEVLEGTDLPKHFSKDNSAWNIALYVKRTTELLMDSLLSNNEVQWLIKSDAQFDVILAEVHQPLMFTFGEKFKAPVIGMLSCVGPLEVYDIYGNPTHPLISPDYNMPLESSPLDHPYTVRVKSFLFNIWVRMLYYWHFLPRSDRIAKKHFGEDFPYLGGIIQRYASILLTNVNVVANPVRANVPSVIEVNRIHIRENQSLPKDLQDYLDSATNGAVYFSLGATVPTSSLNNRTLNEITQAFAQLPYNVLMKWEKDPIPDIPSNVLIRKFFPQQDLLAHPNIHVFVTQGGIQSIEEAIFNEVPMVGIPLIADQPVNIKGIVELGIAVRVNPSEITKNSLTKAILEVAENSSYKKRVKDFKTILDDQPMKGIDKAVWWIEHVIRHKGAQHLRSSAADMSFFYYFMLDVICLLMLLLLFIIFAFYKIVASIRKILKTKHKLE